MEEMLTMEPRVGWLLLLAVAVNFLWARSLEKR